MKKDNNIEQQITSYRLKMHLNANKQQQGNK